MTRKDFELIAKAIRDCELRPDVAEHVAETFAGHLATTNQLFDRRRFIAAATNPESKGNPD